MDCDKRLTDCVLFQHKHCKGCDDILPRGDGYEDSNGRTPVEIDGCLYCRDCVKVAA